MYSYAYIHIHIHRFLYIDKYIHLDSCVCRAQPDSAVEPPLPVAHVVVPAPRYRRGANAALVAEALRGGAEDIGGGVKMLRQGRLVSLG